MFKKMFKNVKSTLGGFLDEVNDESNLANETCYLTVSHTSLKCFLLNQELTITFVDEDIVLSEEVDNGFTFEIPSRAITEAEYRTTTLSGVPIKGTYLAFEGEDGPEYIFFKASTLEPHCFLEYVQRFRIVTDLNDKRYARTATALKKICDGCGAVIHEANCPHCGLMNSMNREDPAASSYEYYIEPQYRAILHLHSTSLDRIKGCEKVYYHVYEDCVTLRIQGAGDNYAPHNIILLYENIVEVAQKQYGSNANETGLHITYRDNGNQFVQFKVFQPVPSSPKAYLDHYMGTWNLQDVFNAIEVQEGVVNRICDYCDMHITTQICPYCGGVN